MDYAKLYESLIEARRIKGIPQGYKEVHHIVPRSFGGSDDPTNLVALTAREHFVAHRLLAKMYPDTGMVHAVYIMACSNRTMKRFAVTSRVYEHLRSAHAYRVSTDEVAKMKKSLAGKGKKQSGNSWLSEDAKRNMSKPRTKVSSRTGRKFSTPEELAGITKMVEARKKNGSYDWTDERKLKQSERLKANPVKKPTLTDAEKQRLREEKTKPVTCPHCGKVGAMMVMPRWHFDNCKEKG